MDNHKNIKEKKQAMKCPEHDTQMTNLGEKRVLDKNNNRFYFPRYKCEKCNRYYTFLDKYGDGYTFGFEGEIYHNINPLNKAKKNILNESDNSDSVKLLSKGTECIVYGVKKKTVCDRPECNQSRLITSSLSTYSKKKKLYCLNVKECPNCGLFYVNYQIYKVHQSRLKCLNYGQLETIEYEVNEHNKERQLAKKRKKYSEEEKRILEEKRIQEETRLREEKRLQEEQERIAKERAEAERKKIEERERQQRVEEFKKKAKEKEEKERLHQKRIEKQRQKADQLMWKFYEKELKQQQVNDKAERSWKASIGINRPDGSVPGEHDDHIRAKDFVVRQSTFGCRHKEHLLKNISAKVGVVTDDGDVIELTVIAGYCVECNTFFILEREYRRLKMHGTPICCIVEEKGYRDGSFFVNGMKLKSQSVLNQYGYSVSEAEGLSEARRRKILSLLIDNKILTNNDVISYLDFFISMRETQDKYFRAISKWERDIEFVSNYKKGEYTQYGVAGIYRKHTNWF